MEINSSLLIFICVFKNYLFNYYYIMYFQNLILLSALQGITEFLPVSSSAHLIIFPNITNNTDQGRIFDVAVHTGSLLAVILYLWRDILRMFVGIFS